MSAKLRFAFRGDLPHQMDAIEATAAVFAGVDRVDVLNSALQTEIVSNAGLYDPFDEETLTENLRRIQTEHIQNHPEAPLSVTDVRYDDGDMLDGVSAESHRSPNLAIEMETGTGKTYVYLRTMLELHRRYGYTKFILVVPSVAILEGVKRSFDDLITHFNEIFGVTNFSKFVYDGGQMQRVRAFCQHRAPSLLITTLQAINRASNNLYKPTEKLQGEALPYQWLQTTRPIVVLDEPQNMTSAQSQAAIRTLRPLFVLRYSATHRKEDLDRSSLLYRLTPLQAFRMGLVKQVTVIGIAELGFCVTNGLKLLGVTRNPVRAQLQVTRLVDGQATRAELTLKKGDDLYAKTGHAEYEGLKIGQITAATAEQPATVELLGGEDGSRTLTTGDEIASARDDIWAAQIEETVKKHFTRQRTLKSKGIKVLSLFFLDRVANYVPCDPAHPPKVRRLFEEIFDRLKVDEPDFRDLSADEVHQGYFARRTRAVRGGETREEYDDRIKADSEEAQLAYEAIMKAKDRLITFPTASDPVTRVSFLFAHSALKEGWDNPNVFQICTLNQTVSLTKKRQEIGRGLRLSVNQVGQRVEAPDVNILTVIANESYESYVRTLQSEYVAAGHGEIATPGRDGDKEKQIRRDDLYRHPAFRAFWERLQRALEYRVDVDADALIDECVRGLNGATFPPPQLARTHGRYIVVDYQMRVVNALEPGAVRAHLRETTSEHQVGMFGVIAPRDHVLTLRKDVNLATHLHNEHFKGFIVDAVDRHLGEWRVRFRNGQQVTETEVLHFTANRVDANPVETIEVQHGEHRVPDVIGRAATETHLTRKTVAAIFDGMNPEKKATLRLHPEAWANIFVRVVGDTLKDHIVARLRFLDTGRTLPDLKPLDEFFPETREIPQGELYDGGPKSLYDRVQVDSQVERSFIDDHLKPDEPLALYFKFPFGFRIPLPRVIGNYNPDWGVLRLDPKQKVILELVRETKGTDDLERLRFSNEGRKLRLAQRYFEALGVDYRFMSPKAQRYWESAAEAQRREHLKVVEAPARATVRVPVYDLRVAAGTFSAGQAPEPLKTVSLDRATARRPGVFIAQVVGRSMDRVVPDGGWALWQRLDAPGVAAATPGERLIARMSDPQDADLGGYTFKVWRRDRGGDRLVPMSTDSSFQAILVEDGADVRFIARFLERVHLEQLDDGPA